MGDNATYNIELKSGKVKAKHTGTLNSKYGSFELFEVIPGYDFRKKGDPCFMGQMRFKDGRKGILLFQETLSTPKSIYDFMLMHEIGHGLGIDNEDDADIFASSQFEDGDKRLRVAREFTERSLPYIKDSLGI